MNAADLLTGALLIPGDEAVSVNVSITQDQANIAWNKAAQWCYDSPHLRHWVVDIITSPFPEIILANGHRIWARSTVHDCRFLRSHKFVRATVDEMAYDKESILEVLVMRLADYNGQLGGCSTPRGKNWYYRKCWKKGELEQREAKIQNRKPKVFIQTGTSYDNPHISHDYLDTRTDSLTDRQRKQEIEGLFLEASGVPWTVESVEGVVNKDLNLVMDHYSGIDPKTRHQCDPREWEEGDRWLISWDLAKKEDWTVGLAGRVDCKPWKIGLWWTRYQKKPWPVVERDIGNAQKRFKSNVVVDASGVGDVTVDHLDVPTHRLTPLVFTPKLKTDMIENLAYCTEKKLYEIPFIKQLVDEMYDYEYEDKELTQDFVMALAMWCWMARKQPGKAYTI